MHYTGMIRLAREGAKNGELRHFDAEQIPLEASVDEEVYIYGFRGISGVPGSIGLLNKFYGFNQLHDDRMAMGFKQPETDPCVFRKFDDKEMEMVVVVHVNNILTLIQVTMERFAADIEGKFKVKSW